jgi:hypothetical protein
LISFAGASVALLLLEPGFRVARHGTVTIDRLEWRDGGRETTMNKVYDKTAEFEFTATMNQDEMTDHVRC